MDNLKVTRLNNVVHGAALIQDINQDGLGRYIFNLMKKNKSAVFQINAATGEEETYEHINQRGVRVGLELQQRGIKEDDVVLVLSGNSMDAMIPILAAFYINAISATLDPSMSLRDVTHLIKMSRPKIIFSVRQCLELLREALDAASIVADVIVMDPSPNQECETKLSDFLVANPKEDEFIPNVVDDAKKTAFILFSSGTTGLPKPLKCSHYALLYSVAGEMLCGLDGSVTLHYSSFYWISAYLMTMYTLISGGRKIIPETHFKPAAALACWNKYKVTLTLLPTSLILKFITGNVQNNNSTYPKYILYGGTAMGADNINKINTYFPNTKVAFVYGLSEVCGTITGYTKSYQKFLRTKPGSVGMPIPGVSIKIADLDTEETLPAYEKGEIRLFTKGSFNGYVGENIADFYDKDGFLKTGDVGYYDEDNCFYVTDRIKEMFSCQGWHIVPNSLEDVIYKHDAVKEVIVIGIPHETDSHHPMAVVVLRNGFEGVDELYLEEFTNQRVLEREKLRAGVRIVKMLPKTPTGKVMRKYVRDLIIDGRIHELQ